MVMNTASKKTIRVIGIITPILLISLFLLFPVFSVLISGFVDESGSTISYLRYVFTNGFYYKLFAFTLSQAFLSTIVSLLVGIPLGYIFGKYEFKGRKIFLTLFTVPFVLPSVLVGMGFLNVFTENGLFGSPLLSIVLAHAFFNIPLVIQYFSSYYQNFDRDLIDAAKTLKSNFFNTFFRVYLPIFLQPILTAAMLTFNFCFLSFGIIYVLGAPEQYRTIEIQIFAEYFKGETNTAAALAIMQLLVTVAYIVTYLLLMRKNSNQQKTMSTSTFPREKINYRKFFASTSGWILFIVFILGLALELLPLISIIAFSFINSVTRDFTFENYRNILSLLPNSYVGISIPRTILNTVMFALAGAAISTFLAIITVISLGRQRQKKKTITYEMISYLPLAVSSMTISLGILRTFGNSQFFINNPWLFIIISHGLLGYPFVTRALLNGLNTIGPEMEESARTLGANFFYKMKKLYLPLLLPSLVAGIAISFGLSIGEFAISNFFYINNNSIATLTVALYKLRAVRQFGQSSAIGAILLIISYLSFFLIELLGGREKTSSKI